MRADEQRGGYMVFGWTRADRFDPRIDATTVAQTIDRIKAALVYRPDPCSPVAPLDLALAAIVGLAAVVLSCWLMAAIPAGLYDLHGFDIWFQADPPRIMEVLTDRASRYNYRNAVHPLFTLIAYPIVAVFRGLGCSPVMAGQAMIAICAFVTVSLLFLTMIRLGFGRAVALLACAVFLSSATFLHWFAVVETYALSSSLSIAAVYLMVRRPVPSATSAVAASFLSLCMVITNWSLGLALVFMRFPLSRFLRYSLVALVLCTVFSGIQRGLFPVAGVFLDPRQLFAETQYVGGGEVVGGAAHWSSALHAIGIVLTSAIAPMPDTAIQSSSGTHVVTYLDRTLAGLGVIGWIAASAWIVALGISVVGLVRDRLASPVIVALALFLAGQVAMHSIYGEEPFLYAADFFVVLVVFACIGAQGRWRSVHMAALVCVVIAGGIANSRAFLASADLARHSLARSAVADGKGTGS